MVQEYPECIDEACDSDAINSMNHIFEIVKGIRNAKAELNIKSSQNLKAIMIVDKNIESVRFNSVFITNLTNVEIDVYDSSFEFKLDTNIPIITSSATTYLEIGNVIDTDSESNRLSDELKTLSNRIKSLESRLSNTKFTENAPKNVVEEEKDRLSDFRDRESKLNQLIAQLRN